MDVAGKVMVVTGGGNGIGREVVREMLRRGARVAAVDLREDSLAETAELAAAGDRLTACAVDVTDRDATAALPDRVTEAFGSVDGLVNVAGIIQPFVRLDDLDMEAIDRVLAVNLHGTINTTKAFLPHLLERPVAHIANVSSMGGFLPVPGQTAYGASKAAVKLLTEGLYAELLDTAVGVSVVFPGAVSTSITENSGVQVRSAPSSGAARRMPTTSPEDAGRIIVDGIVADRFHIFVGRDARLLDLLTRLAPKWSTHLIRRQMRSLLS